MGQISMEKPWLPGSALSGNQQRKLLETGAYNSIEDIARAEKINASYVSRVLRLTLLAPKVVLNLLEQRPTRQTHSRMLLESVEIEWKRQVELLL